ncbi:MacS family sensor histidine kinase [Metallococcus carri]|nr:DUF5931 domain-containing protein [Metallococcus carri]
MLPLWRAAQVFRFASLLYAGAVQYRVNQYYAHRSLSWVVFALVLVWSGIAAVLYSTERRRRPIVIVEVVVTLVLMSSTLLVGPASYFQHHQVVPTSFWSTNAVVSVALLAGPWWGMASAAVVGLSALAICGQLTNISFDATLPILLAVGLALGYGSRVVRQAQERLEQAIRLEAATHERERLAREVHDTTLQVLAYVKRRGSEIGGATTELATLAGDQESALRRLLSRQAAGPLDTDGDLAAALQRALPADVTFSAPADPIRLPAATLSELVAAVSAALDNTARHAGPGARSFVLVEDLGGEVVVTVRDDGSGMPHGRLAEARAEGRLGVSSSIEGRLTALGGRAEVVTAPGEGTEWELTVPVKEGR